MDQRQRETWMVLLVIGIASVIIFLAATADERLAARAAAEGRQRHEATSSKGEEDVLPDRD